MFAAPLTAGCTCRMANFSRDLIFSPNLLVWVNCVPAGEYFEFEPVAGARSSLKVRETHCRPIKFIQVSLRICKSDILDLCKAKLALRLHGNQQGLFAEEVTQ